MYSLIYSGTTLIELFEHSEGVIPATKFTLFQGTRDECVAKIAELGLKRELKVNGRAVPQTITPAQLGVWLIRNSIQPSTVDSAISSIQDPLEKAEAQWLWARSTEIQRNHPLVAAMAYAINLSEEETDVAFIEASQL